MRFVVYLLLITVLSLSIAVGYEAQYAQKGRRDARAKTCEAFIKLDNAILSFIQPTTLKELDKLAYYREHPAEAQLIVDKSIATAAKARLTIVPPSYCN